MSILGVKSIPLMRETNIAWKTVPGFWFVARERSNHSTLMHIRSKRYEAILNLGKTDITFDDDGPPVFNRPDTIRAISTPRALAATLDAGEREAPFVPPPRGDVPHWHKGGGYGGETARFCEKICIANNGSVQQHIQGDEFRVITVGSLVVQASKKGARRVKANGRNDFEYEWVGVAGVRKNGIIPLLHEAVALIPDGERTVLGWDIIHDGTRPWVLEVNTSPGVNEATANRIITAIRSVI